MAHAVDSFESPEAYPIVNVQQKNLNLSPPRPIPAAIHTVKG